MGPSRAIFCVGRKNPKNAKILPIFLGGPMGPIHPVWALSAYPNRYPFFTVRTPQASLIGEKLGRVYQETRCSSLQMFHALKLHQMGPGGFVSTDPDLADILGRTDFHSEIYPCLFSLDSRFLDFQIQGCQPEIASAFSATAPRWLHSHECLTDIAKTISKS